jgi:hypothetical protein
MPQFTRVERTNVIPLFQVCAGNEVYNSAAVRRTQKMPRRNKNKQKSESNPASFGSESGNRSGKYLPRLLRRRNAGAGEPPSSGLLGTRGQRRRAA